MGAAHYVIVGSGIAALAAAETLRGCDASAEITLISEEPHDFYSRPGLAYLLTGEIPEKQLFVRTHDELRALCLNRITARVTQLSYTDHALLLSNDMHVTYDRLLLATGSLAVPAAFEGSELAGIVKLDSLDDARQLMRMTKRIRTAVVIGGGITALELVEGLRARGMKVHYFLRGDRYWADVLDETESQIVQDRLCREGVVIHPQTQVRRAFGPRGRITAVETVAGQRIPCHFMGVAIGVQPRVELAREAGLIVDRGILVNEFLQTSAKDVFAAGDVAEVIDPHSGRSTLDVLWSTAALQGKAAGTNMAGGRRPYVKGIPYNVTRLAGLKVTIIGAVGSGKPPERAAIARGESEAWRLLPKSLTFTERNGVDRFRLLMDQHRIVGALVMGDQTWSHPLQRLIVAGADISPLYAALAPDKTHAVRHLTAFYEQWERSHAR